MKTYKYSVEGMTCQGCVKSLKTKLGAISNFQDVSVQLEPPQASFITSEVPNIKHINQNLGKYNLKEVEVQFENTESSWLSTYKPLLILVGMLISVTLLAQYPFHSFSGSVWMRHFMAGFFLSFSFFKLINIKGFADSYRMYDIVAGRWRGWGFIYPFVELLLGVSYLINWNPILTNAITLVVMIIGTVGVVQANLSKQQIKCACLGDVFNLPMSTVTIIENVAMILMAAWMLL